MDYGALSLGNYHRQMLMVDEAFTSNIRLDIECGLRIDFVWGSHLKA